MSPKLLAKLAKRGLRVLSRRQRKRHAFDWRGSPAGKKPGRPAQFDPRHESTRIKMAKRQSRNLDSPNIDSSLELLIWGIFIASRWLFIGSRVSPLRTAIGLTLMANAVLWNRDSFSKRSDTKSLALGSEGNEWAAEIRLASRQLEVVEYAESRVTEFENAVREHSDFLRITTDPESVESLGHGSYLRPDRLQEGVGFGRESMMAARGNALPSAPPRPTASGHKPGPQRRREAREPLHRPAPTRNTPPRDVNSLRFGERFGETLTLDI